MSNQIQIQNVAEKLILVGVDVRSVSGTVTRDDRPGGDDKDVFTAGSVRYISPILLRPFAAARQAAARACRARGTRFWGAWAVAEEAVPDLMEDLERIAKFVREKKEEVINNWEKELARWETIHPAAATYRNKFPNRELAERGIGIAVSAVRISPTDNVVAGADDAVRQEVLGMPMRVLEEIALDIRDSWKPGAQKATQNIKGLLGRIVSKCRTLAFVGGNLSEVANFVEATIERLPRQGDITGHDFLVLSGMLSLLERPEVVAAGNFSVKVSDEKTEEASPTLTEPASDDRPAEAAYAW